MKKVLIAMTVLAAFGLATVLDGVGGLGLGENPAYPALWKDEKRVDVIAPLSSKTESSDDGTYGSVYKSKQADGGFGLSNISWTDKLGDVWYGISYGPLLSVEEKTTIKHYTTTALTNVESTTTNINSPTGYALNLAAAKDFALFGGFTGGVNLGINQKSSVWTETLKYKDGYKEVLNGSGQSDIYLTLGFGAAKNIAANQKVLFGQTLASKTQYQNGAETRKLNGQKDKDYNDDHKDGTASNGFIPAKTAVGYVYTVDSSLEFGASWAHDWQSAYRKDVKEYTNAVESEEVTIRANDTFSLGVDYIFDQFQVQGYLTMAKGTGIETTDSPDTIDQDELKGVDNTTLGINLLWTPAFANVGTIGLGIENSKEVDYDFGFGPKTDTNISTTLFYTYLF